MLIEFFSLPLYTGRLFQCDMLYENICYFRGVELITPLILFFLLKSLLASNADSDQTVASDLGRHCLPMTFLQVSR